MSIQIHNIRFGLATNSSSSHSLIFLRGGRSDEGLYGRDFGWDRFVAGSRELKLKYMGFQVLHNLDRLVPGPIAGAMAQVLLGEDVDLPKNGADDWDDPITGYVDHQSVYCLPFMYNSETLDPEFIRDMKDFLLQDDLVVLGNNDNDEVEHPLEDGTQFRLPLQRDRAPYNVSRKDPKTGAWTLFSPDSGAKVRFSFENVLGVINSASAPELVDVKITDFCPFDCPFCYQDSTKRGEHADTSRIMRLLDGLSGMKVFEVAIGGGEPTMHPDFIKILQHARRQGIVPNFTTKSLDWLRDAKRWRPILDASGAFAYSVQKPVEVSELATLLEANGFELGGRDGRPGTAQVVLGVVERETYQQILREAARREIRITLLGYKTVGRGGNFRPVEYRDWWLTDLLEIRDQCAEAKTYLEVGIDTALAAESREELEGSGIPRYMYSTTEGTFSMYVDAVAERIGPSSYCADSEMVTVGHTDWVGAIEKRFPF